MEETKYSGKYIKVTEEVMENHSWERCYLKDGVIIFARDSEDKFIMVREKRPHEIEKIRLRFVAGHLEEGLSVEENANKELREEVGLRADNIKTFFKIQTSGTVNNTVHFALASDLHHDPIPNPDGDVILGIEKYSKDEIFQMIMNDQIKWSTAVTGFLRLYLHNL